MENDHGHLIRMVLILYFLTAPKLQALYIRPLRGTTVKAAFILEKERREVALDQDRLGSQP
jgi:hypothetical protein